MSKKSVFNGNQAIARGFYEAGGHVATSYPGSPTVEIIHSLNESYDEIYSEFSVNEKVALEIGIGASFAGARAMVAMKHVGINIAADPLMSFTQTRINGGFLLVTGDDPGMASSQNEQDSRILGKFAHVPILDPCDSDEARRFVKKGLEISEAYSTPVMLRITSRLCHSRSVISIEERQKYKINGFSGNIIDYAMIPPNTYARQYAMKERIEKLSEDVENMGLNHLEESDNKEVLVITSGLMYNNLKELDLDISILKLGMVYPLPVRQIQKLAKKYSRIIVLEEMMPFIENELKIHGVLCEGKKYFSFTNELHTEIIEQGLKDAGIIEELTYAQVTDIETVARVPLFCSGCPHRPVFDILKKERVKVIGDIGCYSLAILPPLEVVKSVISMGASIGIMKGMSKAYQIAGIDEPVVAVIGDGTFYHSGMTGLLNMLHQIDPKANMTLLILNNGTTAMTGGQNTASSGLYMKKADMHVDMEQLIRSMGFDQVRSIDQFKYEEAQAIIKKEIRRNGLSILITTRPCALNFKIKKPYFYVDTNICIGCRSCVKTNCPAIMMKEYQNIDELKSSINRDMCVGCSVCAQVCPVGAIKQSELEGV